MSTRIMALVWPLSLPAPQKSVLVSMADQANDDGVCWPSVGTISQRTGFSERTVQRAVQSLIESGLVEAKERYGTSTYYTIKLTESAANPRQSDTPVTVTPRHSDTPPPSECHPTPVTVTPHPRHSDTLTVIEPKDKQKKARNGTPVVVKPSAVSEEVWSDFLAIRKAKKASVTRTALAGIQREADKAGMSLEDALSMCCSRGWAGFDSTWLKDKPVGNRKEGGIPDFMRGAI